MAAIGTGGFFDLTLYLVFVCFFLVFVYFVTKTIGKTATRSFQGNNMKVVERISLGLDKSLILVTLDNNSYVLYLDKQGCKVVDKLQDLELKDDVGSKNQMIQNVDFTKMIQDKIKNYKGKGE